ncbi:MAG: hypothetical protein R2719_05285 [Micropruina sp.]
MSSSTWSDSTMIERQIDSNACRYIRCHGRKYQQKCWHWLRSPSFGSGNMLLCTCVWWSPPPMLRPGVAFQLADRDRIGGDHRMHRRALRLQFEHVLPDEGTRLGRDDRRFGGAGDLVQPSHRPRPDVVEQFRGRHLQLLDLEPHHGRGGLLAVRAVRAEHRKHRRHPQQQRPLHLQHRRIGRVPEPRDALGSAVGDPLQQWVAGEQLRRQHETSQGCDPHPANPRPPATWVVLPLPP